MNVLNTQGTYARIKTNPLPKRLLVDFSGLGYRTVFSVKDELIKAAYTDWRIFKFHMIDFIMEMKSKIGPDTEVIIACDQKVNGDYWRANIFPGYKKKRQQDKQDIPKDLIKQAFGELQEEMRTQFPFRLIRAEGVEADDIIAMYALQETHVSVIVSVDYDLFQLVDNHRCFMFSLTKNFFVEGPTPKQFVFEKIVRGDTSDNIANIESDLDAIINPTKRQKKLMNDKYSDYWKVYDEHGEDVFINFLREEQRVRFRENKALMDLRSLPKDIKERIVNKINESSITGNANTAFKYCMTHGMRNLVQRFTGGN